MLVCYKVSCRNLLWCFANMWMNVAVYLLSTNDLLNMLWNAPDWI